MRVCGNHVHVLQVYEGSLRVEVIMAVQQLTDQGSTVALSMSKKLPSWIAKLFAFLLILYRESVAHTGFLKLDC